MSYRYYSFFFLPRVASRYPDSFPSLDPISAALPLPLRLLTFLPLLPLPCHSFRFARFVVSRFVFAFDSSLERTDRALSHGGDSFIPVARKLPRKGERTPSRTTASGELAGAQEIVLLILLRRGRDSCAVPSAFLHLARASFFFLFLSVCRVLLPR